MNDDAELIEEALAGTEAAFGQLVRKYQDRLFNTLVHVTGSSHEAEDVAQEAFIQALRKLSTFRRKSSFYTWLYRIAFNLWISRRRRRRWHPSLQDPRHDVGCDPIDTADTPDVGLQRSERVAQVQAALMELSDEHRTILVLREMEGCCYETIAEALDLPIGTVRSRLYRARSQLRQRLREVVQES